MNLTKKEKEYIEKVGILENEVYDASNLDIAKTRLTDILKPKGYSFAITRKPCIRGHRLYTRNGTCIVCAPQSITHLKRHYNPSTVYVFYSNYCNLKKVGYSKNIKERLNEVNRQKRAGYDDWKVLYSAEWEHAGKIETEIKKKLNKYRKNIEYTLGEEIHKSKEMFDCDISFILDTINQMKNQLSNEKYSNEYINEDIKFIKIKQKKSTSNNSDDKKTHTKFKINNEFVRKSEFDESLKSSKQYSKEEIEEINILQDKKASNKTYHTETDQIDKTQDDEKLEINVNRNYKTENIKKIENKISKKEEIGDFDEWLSGLTPKDLEEIKIYMIKYRAKRKFIIFLVIFLLFTISMIGYYFYLNNIFNIYLLFYIILVIPYIFLFMSQRTALMITRYNNIPPGLTDVIMPYWQIISSYIIIFLLFINFVMIWISSIWYIAIGIGLLTIIATAFVPIPYYLFLDSFENYLKIPETKITRSELNSHDDDSKKWLLSALNNYRSELMKRENNE